MKDVLGLKRRRNAQSLVFFLLAWGTIMLLAGLAIDSGLLYLAKARLARAVDGAVLAAVGNFNRSGISTVNRDDVALIMRNFAAANYTDLSPISATGGPTGGTPITTTGTNGQPVTSYTYSFNDGTQDANGAYRRFVDVTLNTGSNGAITSATCNARCPVQTYFIGYAAYAIGNRQNVKIAGYSGVSGLMDLKVSSSAVATRNPRLIMVVIDRSASMLQQGGGATGLPTAVVQFLDFFDTSSDSIGIVSFGSSARLEMPMTTNFILAGTNNLIDAYMTNGPSLNVPGVDPESISTYFGYEGANYNIGGVRRLKFGGQTAAADGIRLAMEQMMANSGFTDPDVIKYMVIFTDGAWNAGRTLVAAPGYVNTVEVPTADTTNVFLTNQIAQNTLNGASGAWNTDLTKDTNLIAMPSMGLDSTRSSLVSLTNSIAATQLSGSADFTTLIPYHTNDVWQSSDGIYEPLTTPTQVEGAYMGVTNTSWVSTSSNGLTNYYTHNFDVWLQPGSVAFYYPLTNATPVAYVSDYTNPKQHINLNVGSGGKVVLVVPGYVADGLLYDGLDLGYSDPPTPGYPRFRGNNYQEAFMWPDDTMDPPSTASAADPYSSNSLMRQLMFRNYANLLTGFYVFRADEPLAPYSPSLPVGQQGIEPLISDQTNSAGAVGAPRSRWALGAYYPSAGFYWPFGGDTDDMGYVTNAVGVDYDPTYALPNPNNDPDPNFSNAYNGGSRHIAYSINMLSTNAEPEWSGELFYNSISGAGTGASSGVSSTAQSQIMQSAAWKNGASSLPFMAPFLGQTDSSGHEIMIDEATHNTTIAGSPSVWRPVSFNGSNYPVSYAAITPNNYSYNNGGTGGFVSDGHGNYYANAMAWSGRPTHYYDFSQSKWVRVADNHDKNVQILPIGNWQAIEYAWHARASGVTIYTVGYGSAVTPAECSLLAEIANATNVIAPVTTGSTTLTTNVNTFNAGQPLGAQYYATTPDDISNDFYSVGQAINAALTQ